MYATKLRKTERFLDHIETADNDRIESLFRELIEESHESNADHVVMEFDLPAVEEPEEFRVERPLFYHLDGGEWPPSDRPARELTVAAPWGVVSVADLRERVVAQLRNRRSTLEYRLKQARARNEDTERGSVEA